MTVGSESQGRFVFIKHSDVVRNQILIRDTKIYNVGVIIWESKGTLVTTPVPLA